MKRICRVVNVFKMIEDIVELKQVKNLFNVLIRDENNVFYGASQITKNLVRKIKKFDYKTDKASLSIYKKLEDKKGVLKERKNGEQSKKNTDSFVYVSCRTKKEHRLFFCYLQY